MNNKKIDKMFSSPSSSQIQLSSGASLEHCSPFNSVLKTSAGFQETVRRILEEGVEKKTSASESTVSQSLLNQFEKKNCITLPTTQATEEEKGNAVFMNQIVLVLKEEYPEHFQQKDSVISAKTVSNGKSKEPNTLICRRFPLHRISAKDLSFKKQIKYSSGNVEIVENPFFLPLRYRKHRDWTLWQALRPLREPTTKESKINKKRKEMTWEQKKEEDEIEMNIKKYKSIQDDLAKCTSRDLSLQRIQFLGSGHTSVCYKIAKYPSSSSSLDKKHESDEEEEEEDEEEEEKNQYACKVIPSTYLKGNTEKQGFSHRIHIGKEIQILNQLNHPRIIKLHEVAKDELNIYLVTELCQTRSLSYYIEQKKIKSLSQCIELLYQMLKGIEVIHSHRVVHRDLKPSNLFVEKNKENNLNLKFADFGFACQLPEEETKTKINGFIGTPNYSSPEMVLASPYNKTIARNIHSILTNQLSSSSSSSSSTSTSLDEFDSFVKHKNKEIVSVPSLQHIQGLNPESYGEYSYALDIWSIGVIFYRLLFFSYPFSPDQKATFFLETKTTKEVDQTDATTTKPKVGVHPMFSALMTQILQGVYEIPHLTWWGKPIPKPVSSVLKEMLTWNWIHRPDASTLLKHKLFQFKKKSDD